MNTLTTRFAALTAALAIGLIGLLPSGAGAQIDQFDADCPLVDGIKVCPTPEPDPEPEPDPDPEPQFPAADDLQVCENDWQGNNPCEEPDPDPDPDPPFPGAGDFEVCEIDWQGNNPCDHPDDDDGEPEGQGGEETPPEDGEEVPEAPPATKVPATPNFTG